MTPFLQIMEKNIGYRLHDVDYSAVEKVSQGRAQLVVDLPLPNGVPFFIRVRSVDADDLIARLPENDRLTETGTQP